MDDAKFNENITAANVQGIAPAGYDSNNFIIKQ